VNLRVKIFAEHIPAVLRDIYYFMTIIFLIVYLINLIFNDFTEKTQFVHPLF
jgi:hypothetical protein